MMEDLPRKHVFFSLVFCKYNMNSQNKGDNMAFNLSRQPTIEDDKIIFEVLLNGITVTDNQISTHDNWLLKVIADETGEISNCIFKELDANVSKFGRDSSENLSNQCSVCTD